MGHKPRLLPPIPLSEFDPENPPLGRLIIGELNVDPPNVAQETDLTRVLAALEPGQRVLPGMSSVVDAHLEWLAEEAGINQLRQGVGGASIDGDEQKRLMAYAKRHGGRDASLDCYAGLLPAAPVAVDQWLEECMRATSNRAAWPSLPRWVSRQIQGSLAVYRALRDDNMERLFDDDTLLFFDALIDDSAASAFDRTWRTFDHAVDLKTKSDAYKPLEEAYRRFVPLAGDWPIPKEDDIRIRDVIAVLDELRCRVTGRETSTRHRPKDRVARAFYEGICVMFSIEKLGEPTPTDLADLSLAAGMNVLDEGYDTADRIADRWKKRVLQFQREKSNLIE